MGRRRTVMTVQGELPIFNSIFAAGLDERLAALPEQTPQAHMDALQLHTLESLLDDPEQTPCAVTSYYARQTNNPELGSDLRRFYTELGSLTSLYIANNEDTKLGVKGGVKQALGISTQVKG